MNPLGFLEIERNNQGNGRPDLSIFRMDGPDVGNEGTISSLLLVPAVKFIKVLRRIRRVWLEWQAMVNCIVQAY